MGCTEANERMRANTRAIMRGDTRHPVHEHMPVSGADGIETGKRMYRRFYGNERP
jgi:hypothetical protein